MLKDFKFLSFFIIISVFMISCSEKENMENKSMLDEFNEFALEFEKKAAKAYFEVGDSYFKASVNSTPEAWELVAAKDSVFNDVYSDTESFEQAKKYHESDLGDELANRHAEIIYMDLLSKQLPKDKLNKLSKMQSEVESKYSSFRAEIDGEKYDDNQIEEILKTSTDQDLLKNAWEAHKNIGPLVKDDIIAMIKLRNEMAVQLGYDNYHQMSLALSEQEPQMIETLFDELDDLTRDAYAEVKNEIDSELAKQNGISQNELMPWHYQNRFFQEAPSIYELDLDALYKGKDLVKLTETYFAGIGMPIERIVANSDLFPKENKNQHAYCYNIERSTEDIRVLCNVVDNSRWMETMLHEFGHAVYEDYYRPDLPWSLKTPAHTFVTEAIAMLFGRMALSPDWMVKNIDVSNEEAEAMAETAHKIQKMQMLVFSRWAQVMYRFEKAMYENPNQDLNKLWWDLVEKYQMIKKPADRDMPDWATKIHIATSPCYYHNYLMGELLASQLYFTLIDKAGSENTEDESFSNKPEVGKYLSEEMFSYGNSLFWNDLIEKVTGEKLTAKYYSQQFVN